MTSPLLATKFASYGIEPGWRSMTEPPIQWKSGDEFEAARKASR